MKKVSKAHLSTPFDQFLLLHSLQCAKSDFFWGGGGGVRVVCRRGRESVSMTSNTTNSYLSYTTLNNPFVSFGNPTRKVRGPK